MPAASAAGADACDCPGSYTAGFPLHPFSTSCASLTTCLHVATVPLGANTPSLSEQLCVATLPLLFSGVLQHLPLFPSCANAASDDGRIRRGGH